MVLGLIKFCLKGISQSLNIHSTEINIQRKHNIRKTSLFLELYTCRIFLGTTTKNAHINMIVNYIHIKHIHTLMLA